MAANDSLQFFRHRLVGIINHNYEISLLFLGGKNDKNYKMQQLNKKKHVFPQYQQSFWSETGRQHHPLFEA